MIKRFSKIIMCLIICLTLISITSVSKAESFWGDIFKYGDNFLDEGKAGASSSNYIGPSDETLQTTINDIYSILVTLGGVITVIVGGVLGIKFMIASADDKAKIKESMIPYVMGCVAIYGAFGIWKICIEIFSAVS